MKDGVEYVLRFGDLTDAASAEQKDNKDETAEAVEAKPATSDVHRYMFVMARFNEDAVQKPELQPLPELPADEPAATEEPKPADEPAATGESAPDGESISVDGSAQPPRSRPDRRRQTARA